MKNTNLWMPISGAFAGGIAVAVLALQVAVPYFNASVERQELKLTNEISTLTQEITSLKSEISELNIEKTELTKYSDNLQDSINTLSANLTQLQTDLENQSEASKAQELKGNEQASAVNANSTEIR